MNRHNSLSCPEMEGCFFPFTDVLSSALQAVLVNFFSSTKVFLFLYTHYL